PPDIHKIRRQVTQSFSKAPRFSAMNLIFAACAAGATANDARPAKTAARIRRAAFRVTIAIVVLQWDGTGQTRGEPAAATARRCADDACGDACGDAPGRAIDTPARRERSRR
ncbi:hypothetical protein, partial [Burkholderia pseudomallei]